MPLKEPLRQPEKEPEKEPLRASKTRGHFFLGGRQRLPLAVAGGPAAETENVIEKNRTMNRVEYYMI